MTKISVIIPTYNDKTTLPLTIETLKKQTLEDFEVIIVNDGGEKPENFLDLNDKRFKILNLDSNEGVSKARNIGFLESSGDILYFLDADDYVCSDLLMFAKENMEKEKCSFFAVRHHSINVDEVEQNKHLLDKSVGNKRVSYLDPEQFYKEYSGIIVFIPSTVFFRRSAILETLGSSPWNLNLRNAQDTLLLLQIGGKYGVVQSLEKLVLYSVRQNSLSRKPLRTWNARINSMDILVEYLKKNNNRSYLIKIAQKMRHNAARRVARIHFAEGDKKVGLNYLVEDIRNSFSLKTLVEIPRLVAFGS